MNREVLVPTALWHENSMTFEKNLYILNFFLALGFKWEKAGSHCDIIETTIPNTGEDETKCFLEKAPQVMQKNKEKEKKLIPC